MAGNLLLSSKTIGDIERRVDRVLRGVGSPEPPLRLEDVRELLELDLQFYTADDPGLAREVVSRIRVATVQVYRRPTLLIDAIRKLSLKALYVPDRKQILLDVSLPQKKHRWNEAHEVGHSLIPWHGSYMQGDNEHTLSASCLAQIEAEANYAAGRLLFLGDRFVEDARARAPTIASVQDLHGLYGNTLSTTLYRFVENLSVPAVGLISDHPHVDRRSETFDPNRPCRYIIRSRPFATQYQNVSEVELFNAIAGYCGRQRGGPLGTADLVLTDDNDENHRFIFETFFNRYDALTLGVYSQPERVWVAT